MILKQIKIAARPFWWQQPVLASHGLPCSPANANNCRTLPLLASPNRLLHGGDVSTCSCSFLYSSSDRLLVPLALPHCQQASVCIAAVSEHVLVDLQCGVTGFGVEDLAEAFSLSLHSWDGLWKQRALKFVWGWTRGSCVCYLHDLDGLFDQLGSCCWHIPHGVFWPNMKNTAKVEKYAWILKNKTGNNNKNERLMSYLDQEFWPLLGGWQCSGTVPVRDIEHMEEHQQYINYGTLK